MSNTTKLFESFQQSLKEEEEMIQIPSTLLATVVDSLDTVTDYADDGNLDRDDPDFSDFFEAIDRARNLSQEITNKYLGL